MSSRALKLVVSEGRRRPCQVFSAATKIFNFKINKTRLSPQGGFFLPESHLHRARAGSQKRQHLLTVQPLDRSASHGQQLRPHLLHTVTPPRHHTISSDGLETASGTSFCKPECYTRTSMILIRGTRHRGVLMHQRWKPCWWRSRRLHGFLVGCCRD